MEINKRNDVLVMSGSFFSKQITNKNFLSPTGFKFSLAKYPKIDFFSNQASIPGIDLGVALQPSYLKDIPIPGDKLSYGDFSLKFMVDEDMENYLTVHNWLRGFGFPESVQEYLDLQKEEKIYSEKFSASTGQSDGSLLIYNSNFNPVVKVVFKDLFPVSLTSIVFDASDTNVSYASAEVTFKYTIFAIGKYEY